MKDVWIIYYGLKNEDNGVNNIAGIFYSREKLDLKVKKLIKIDEFKWKEKEKDYFKSKNWYIKIKHFFIDKY